MRDPTHRAARDRYKRLFTEISALLFRHDPVGINFEDNTDEYDPEARTILPRLRHCSCEEEVRQAVYDEFVHWFGVGTAGPIERYERVAPEIWQLWMTNRPAGGQPAID